MGSKVDLLHFDVDIGPIIATVDDIAMDVNEEPIRVESLTLRLCCTSRSCQSLEYGLCPSCIFTFPCMIVDSRMNIFDEGGNDIEIWCNHGLKWDQGVKEDVRDLVSKASVPRYPCRVQNEEIT